MGISGAGGVRAALRSLKGCHGHSVHLRAGVMGGGAEFHHTADISQASQSMALALLALAFRPRALPEQERFDLLGSEEEGDSEVEGLHPRPLQWGGAPGGHGAVSRCSHPPLQPCLSLLPTSLHSPVRKRLWFPNKPASLVTPSGSPVIWTRTRSLPPSEPASSSDDPIYR